jgi:hypothetical protein
MSQFMLQESTRQQSQTPDNPLSLYEGIAGSLCFLLDLLEPQSAVFPLFELPPVLPPLLTRGKGV